MQYKQKIQYFVYGVIATAVLVPLLLKAKETIRLTFQEGDVLSASVMNAVLDRIENATSTLKADDLVGTWTVTQIVPYNGQPGSGNCRLQSLTPCTITGTVDAADGMTRSRTDRVTITKTGSAYVFSQSNVSSFVNAHTNLANNGNLSVIAETLIWRIQK